MVNPKSEVIRLPLLTLVPAKVVKEFDLDAKRHHLIRFRDDIKCIVSVERHFAGTRCMDRCLFRLKV